MLGDLGPRGRDELLVRVRMSGQAHARDRLGARIVISTAATFK